MASRSPICLCDIEGGSVGFEMIRSGLTCWLISVAVCNEDLVEVGVGSSSASNGEFSGISSDSRAYSSLKMSGSDLRLANLEPDEEIDRLESRGDILRVGRGPGLCKSTPEPPIKRLVHRNGTQL